MKTDIVKHDAGAGLPAGGAATNTLTATVNGQLIGIPVAEVEDVLAPQTIARIPLAPREVAGSLNLRGRIVTAVDMRARLGLPARGPNERAMNIVVNFRGDLYSLMVDKVGEAMDLPTDLFEANSATIDASWRSIATGIYRLKESLLVSLDVARLLDIGGAPPGRAIATNA